MVKLRRILADYQDIFFLTFVLIMFSLVSAGFTSSELIYKLCFAVGACFWGLKMFVTDFSLKEIVITVLLFGYLCFVLLHNGEKTLLFSAMAVVAAKNVSFDKTVRYGFAVKCVVTLSTMVLAISGLIENVLYENTKNSAEVENYCFGYIHPNAAYINIYVLAVLLILIFRDRLKWYFLILMTGVMYAFYLLLMCRTGFIVWILTVCIVFGYRIGNRLKKGTLYLNLLALIPWLLTIVTIITAVMYKNGNQTVKKLNSLLHYRISYTEPYLGKVMYNPFGSSEICAFDNGYFHVLYNYGWIFLIVFLTVLSLALQRLVRKNMPYEAMYIAIMSIYFYMEHGQLSVGWNPGMILLSAAMFDYSKTKTAADSKKSPLLPNGLKIAAIGCLIFCILGSKFVTDRLGAVDTWCNHAADSFDKGSGTAEDPYIIDTPEQFALIAAMTNRGDDTKGLVFRLNSNLNMGAYRWQPIGYKYPFKGVLDGNGHKVQKLYIGTDEECTIYGLFGVLDGTVANLRVNDSELDISYVSNRKKWQSAENCYAGMIAGKCNGNIYGVSVSMDVSVKNVNNFVFGGLSGRLNDADVCLCVAKCDATVEASTCVLVGGLCGSAEGDSNILKCSIAGNIEFAKNTECSNASVGGAFGSIPGGNCVISDVGSVFGINITDNCSAPGQVYGFIGDISDNLNLPEYSNCFSKCTFNSEKSSEYISFAESYISGNGLGYYTDETHFYDMNEGEIYSLTNQKSAKKVFSKRGYEYPVVWETCKENYPVIKYRNNVFSAQCMNDEAIIANDSHGKKALFRNGVLDIEASGLTVVGDDRWLIRNGYLYEYSGVRKLDGEKLLLKDGRVNKEFSGVVHKNGKTWYVVMGRCKKKKVSK